MESGVELWEGRVKANITLESLLSRKCADWILPNFFSAFIRQLCTMCFSLARCCQLAKSNKETALSIYMCRSWFPMPDRNSFSMKVCI